MKQYSIAMPTLVAAVIFGAAAPLAVGQNLDGFTKNGQQATFEDIGLGTRPVGARQPVRVVPFANLGGNIAQMATVGDRLFFGRNDGAVLEFDTDGNQVGTLLNVSSLRAGFFNNSGPFSGAGLRGIAFHPDFDSVGSAGEGKFYTMHKENAFGGAMTHGIAGSVSTDHYTLGEWDFTNLIGGNPAFRSVMRIGIFSDGDGNTGGHHAGTQLGFNPAAQPGDADYGNIYFGVGDVRFDGDGGTGGTRNVGQDTSNVLGSIVRVDPLGASNGDFTVPADNPFVGAAGRDEIFAYGFRNPSTLSFDIENGQLYVGDIGEHTIEEINLIENGGNYGWGTREGGFAFEGSDNNLSNQFPSTYVPLGNGTDVDQTSTLVNGVATDRLTDEFIDPVARFSHSGQVGGGANAIIGGSVYRGQLAAELRGLYLFGNLSKDDVFYSLESELSNDGVPAEVFELALQDETGTSMTLGEIVGVGANGRANARFGQDEDGEIYIISKADDVIYRLEGTPVPEDPSIQGDLDIDLDVDQDDIDLFVDGWFDTAPIGIDSWMQGDLNLDGVTDLLDLFLMNQALADQGLSIPLEALQQTIPEPSTLTFAIVGLLMASRCRRKPLSSFRY